MRVGVPKETLPDEHRVALVPDAAQKLIQQGFEVWVEKGAGQGSFFSDEAYEGAGAQVVDDPWPQVDALVKVQPPTAAEAARLAEGAVVISFLQPAANVELLQVLAGKKATAFSLELLPRISRAQSMDALSSQANIGGYKAVVIAAARLGKLFPMLMTAAGTIAPARVLVLGAGVAGLQAIATARRLGAVVEAYDVRPAAKEDVKSLGATFVELELEVQQAQDAGGYAREQSEATLRRQRELIGDHVAASDVVISTAAVPGRPAPLLITADMVRRMRRGSVIVDLAAETGGNCELTRAGEEVVEQDVLILGPRNVPSTVPVHASQLFSRNVSALLLHLVKDGRLEPDFEDEIVRTACVTRDGEVVHGPTRELMDAKR